MLFPCLVNTDSVFKTCDLDAKGKLDFSEFKKFIANEPDVVQMLETALARHAWNPLDTQNREHEYYTFDPVRLDPLPGLLIRVVLPFISLDG